VYRVSAEHLLTHLIQFDAVEVSLLETGQHLDVTAVRVVIEKPARNQYEY
jgi:hypothetical protein